MPLSYYLITVLCIAIANLCILAFILVIYPSRIRAITKIDLSAIAQQTLSTKLSIVGTAYGILISRSIRWPFGLRGFNFAAYPFAGMVFTRDSLILIRFNYFNRVYKVNQIPFSQLSRWIYKSGYRSEYIIGFEEQNSRKPLHFICLTSSDEFRIQCQRHSRH